MAFQLPPKVILEEQGPRDGFQSEARIVPTEKKLEIINALVEAGLKRIEVTSFVHPDRVPQMADAEHVCAGLIPKDNVIYSALVLNLKGIERAIRSGLTHLSASVSASDTHSRKNANATLPQARKQFRDMVKFAKDHGITLRGGVQCAFGCRYEGFVDPQVVAGLVAEQLDLGIDALMLADSTGMANPLSIQQLSEKVLSLADPIPVFLHLHDTEAKGLANALAALSVGVTHFDTALAGMGGCPFIRGASGNISTDDLTLMLAQMNIETGIDVNKLAAVSRSMERFFEKHFTGCIHRILDREDIKIIA